MSSNYHPQQQQQQQIRLPPESVNEGTVMIVLPLALALASLTEQHIYPCPNFTQQRLCATWTYPNPNLKNRTTEPLWHNETTLPLSIVTRRVRSQSLSATTIRLTHHWSMLFIRLTNHCFMIFIWLTHLWSMLFIWLTHIWSPIPLSPSLSQPPPLPMLLPPPLLQPLPLLLGVSMDRKIGGLKKKMKMWRWNGKNNQPFIWPDPDVTNSTDRA